MIVLLIHLPSASHRAANVAQIKQDLKNFEVQVIPGVEGKNLDAKTKAQVLDMAPHKPAYPFGLNAGEIGCFLSHRVAWQALLDSSHDEALIFEDDAIVDPDQMALDLAKIGRHRYEFVQLQTRPLKSGSQGLLRERPLPLRATGQWVTRHAATQLLAQTHTFDRPVDTFLQMVWLHGVDIHTLYPSGVQEAPQDISATTIQTSKPRTIFGELRKSLHRTLYRRRVALKSRRTPQ